MENRPRPSEQPVAGATSEATIKAPSSINPDEAQVKPVISIQTGNHEGTKSGFRRKILDNLFEFFMLFLAVFCGFIAENWREQLSERQREREFIRSIVEDIKSDNTQSAMIITRLSNISMGLDSVLAELAMPGVAENSNRAYTLWTENLGLDVFASNDRTIQQLKNNGELRLIRNKAVSDRIMEYDQTIKKYYVQSNLMYSALPDMTYYSQLFDFIKLETHPGEPIPLTPQGKLSLNQAYSRLRLWNKGLGGLISWLKVVNEEGNQLLIFIRDEYDLD